MMNQDLTAENLNISSCEEILHFRLTETRLLRRCAACSFRLGAVHLVNLTQRGTKAMDNVFGPVVVHYILKKTEYRSLW